MERKTQQRTFIMDFQTEEEVKIWDIWLKKMKKLTEYKIIKSQKDLRVNGVKIKNDSEEKGPCI